MFLTFKNKIKKIRKSRFETGLKPVFKPVFLEPVLLEPVLLEPVFLEPVFSKKTVQNRF